MFVARETARDTSELAWQMARGEVKAASIAWATREELRAQQRENQAGQGPSAAQREHARARSRAPEDSLRAKVRDAFAQFEPSDQKKPEPKPHLKRKIAKKHLAPPRVLVAQQPRFGLFVSNTW